jgi:hypothetical protein
MSNLIDSDTARWDSRLFKVCMLIARLGLAYLFFTQLFWKLPPTFGCGANFAFPKPTAQNYYDTNQSSGLCFWMGLESVFASQPRQVLVADMRPAGLPTLSVSITPLAKINGVLLDRLIIPNIALFGWLVWLAEFSIFGSPGSYRHVLTAVYRLSQYTAPIRMGVELRHDRCPVDCDVGSSCRAHPGCGCLAAPQAEGSSGTRQSAG